MSAKKKEKGKPTPKTKPLRSKLLAEHHAELTNYIPIPELQDAIQHAKDDRSMILVLNIGLEKQIDVLLSYMISSYSSLTGLNYNSKIGLLEAFDLIPDSAISAIRLLQRIRNKFAHVLTYGTFDQLDKESIKAISDGFQAYSTIDVSMYNFSLQKKINQIHIFAASSLSNFEPSIKDIRKYLDSAEFKKQLKDANTERVNAQYNRMVRQYLLRNISPDLFSAVNRQIADPKPPIKEAGVPVATIMKRVAKED